MRQKTLFAGLVLAGLAAGAVPAMAQSNVTLYGIIDDALTYSSNQNGKSNTYLRNGNLAGSRWGLRGTEDLGGGTRALFQLENGFDVNSGAFSTSGVMFNRQAFVGLKNDNLGTLTIGRQYTPYYLLVGTIGPTTYLTGATGAHPGDIDGLDTTIRINNSVTYTSPVLWGVTASLQYGFGGQAGAFSKGNMYSGALRYDGGPLSIAAGYLRMNNVGGGTSWNSASTGSFGTSAVNQGYVTADVLQHMAVAGIYTIGNVTLGASYSNVQYKPGAASLFHDTAVFNTAGVHASWIVAPQWRLAAAYSYTAASKSNGISDAATYHQVSLAQVYSLSKRTSLYALEAWQHASGKSLSANASSIINAGPVVGDSQNSTPSSTSSQFVGMLGIRVDF
ncbi:MULTISPECIES: porin [Pandoraea]|uniref:Porin n=1 Tax=Pandoraea nosoerga TaxID=2508296 RepID=A0A5E4SVM4_9BURK|nr:MULTISPECIES: porin [Pandoraea]VVD79191.1 porin [Pandoraea nosoerga]